MRLCRRLGLAGQLRGAILGPAALVGGARKRGLGLAGRDQLHGGLRAR
jgi:hypothetical protein